MAAGLGFKTFTTGEVLTAADTNGYLMQGILVFASAAARDSAITSPQEGQACYLKDTNQVLTYSGSAWVAVGGGSPLTTKGDLYTFSTVDARLGVGANGTTLVADSAQATGLKWATASSGLTFISRTTFSAAASVTIDSLFSDTYENYLVRIQANATAGPANLRLQFRYGSTTHTSANYDYGWCGVDNASSTLRVLNGTTTYIDLDQMNTSYTSLYDFNVCRLSGSNRIQLTGQTWGQENARGLSGGAFCATQQAWSGILLTPSSSTLNGQITVYGLAKS